MKTALSLTLFLSFCASALAQGRAALVEEDDVWKYGIHFSNWQQDGGGGLSISTPFYKGLAFRFKGQLMIHEYFNQTTGETNLAQYAGGSAGLAFIVGRIGETVRIYGEGGPVVVIPSEELSNSNSKFGGYALLGSEWIASRSRTYLSFFIETGYVGTLARADLAPRSPYFATGFMLNAGIRLHP
ncbi:hypothetical protein AB9P05_22770 [Roseivirga sp. BDSF3-8]|uniref:hypothetical protein n=1 Tax=Roseivirga sp. BDSF3-8 TaxID=3241598 RepID=UPI00353239C3